MPDAEMAVELEYFFAMVFYGGMMAACYHPLVFFRTVVHHSGAVVDAEDILFLTGAGFLFFLTAYEKNDGILRWYAFAGAAIGIWLYLRTIFIPLEYARKWILQKWGKPYKIKAHFMRKGQVSVDEGSSPEHKSKRKKKKRSESDCAGGIGTVCSDHLRDD